MKQLILKTNIENEIITTTKTRWNDVIDKLDIVLAVGRNTRATYIVKRLVDEVVVYNPQFWGKICGKFDHLWEMQHFYDMFLFKSFTELESYMEAQTLAWGEGGN